ncbi:AMP-binding protein [Nesterenkonia pannonica]|uniref:AMP-binding protein n=1 Tax=Nesterenkonia pannonica TaxID=1548602 RepID=UPI0021644FB1|nr:AMP-binding protein [Nesterenkonia pannonica]
MRENHANIWQQIARTRPEKIALVSGDRRYTYEEFEQLAEKAAGTLSSHGVRSGDAVGFYLHNTAEFLIAFYACLKLGATPAPMNYRYRGAEVAELVQTSQPKAMLYRAASREEAAEAQRLLDESAPALWVEIDDDSAPQGRGPEGAISFDELLQGPRHEDSGPISPDGELYIFTGGTTGRPKAVVWEIGGLMDIQGSSTYPPIGLDIPETLEQAVGIATSESTPQVNTLPLAPFIHATALFMSTNTLNVGGTVVVNPNASLDARAAADLAIREHVTQLIVAYDAVALPAVEAFEEHPDRDELAVQSVLSSGMRFSDETKARLHRVAP